MLYAEPVGLLSRRYRVRSGDEVLTELRLAAFRDAAMFTLDGKAYTMRRERPMSGAFVLATASGPVAGARKPSALRNRFEVDHPAGSLLIESVSAWKPIYRVGDGGGQVGWIRRRAWYSRVVEADLPDDLPLAVRVFVLWLVLVLLHRSDAAAISSAGAGGS